VSENDHARLSLLLALADDELILGHRHSEWTGWAPMIEVDLAFSSIAQDEIAHAQILYELAEPLDGREPDALALGRHPGEYRNAIVCEHDSRDWGYTLARHYLYDVADDVRLGSLESSSWSELAKAVSVIRLEERYHLDHARSWLRRLTGAGHGDHLSGALATVAGEVSALFEPLWEEDVLVRSGELPRPHDELRQEWQDRVTSELSSYGLPVPDFTPAATGGRYGQRSPDFAPLWEDLTGLYRTHQGATW